MKWLLSVFVFAVLAAQAKRRVFVYIHTSITWNDPCIDIKHIIDKGVTEVLLAFWHDTGATNAAEAWEWMTEDQRTECLAYAHERGAKILLAAGGATDTPYDTTTGADYGTRAAQGVLDFGLDGLNFDIQFLSPYFGDTAVYQWLVDCSLAARRVFDKDGTGHKIITHAPQAPYFTAWAGSNLGYVQLMKDVGHAVDYYLIQYYNQYACAYMNYQSLFVASEAGCKPPGGSILEIKEALGFYDKHLYSKLVVGKPVTTADVYNTGYLPPDELAIAVCEAEQKDAYYGGIMGWSYRGMSDDATNRFLNVVTGNRCSTDSFPPADETLPDGAAPAPSVAPPSGSMNCFHNKEDVWWTSDCSDADACLYGAEYTTEAACHKSGMPYTVWNSSADACRIELFTRGGCGTRAPAVEPPNSADGAPAEEAL